MTVKRFCSEAPLGLLVLGSEGVPIEEVEFVGPVAEAVAEDVDGAALGDLALEAGQEPAAGGAVFGQSQGRGGFRLGRAFRKARSWTRSRQYSQIVVVGVAVGPADTAVSVGGLADRATVSRACRRGRRSGPCR